MIKYSEIEKAFAETNIVVHEYNIELNEEEIGVPFLVYTATSNDDFLADGVNYISFINIGLALIDETLDFEMQRKIESVFAERDVSYDKQINFDDGARLYTITYYFSVLDDGGDV